MTAPPAKDTKPAKEPKAPKEAKPAKEGKQPAQEGKPAKGKSAKELKKAQKQAQRAQRKEQMATAGGGHPANSSQPSQGGSGGNTGGRARRNSASESGAPGAQQQGGAAAGNGAHGGPSNNNNNGGGPSSGSGSGASGHAGSGDNIVLQLFGGIDQPKAVVSRKSVHPAILHLALQMQSCRIIGSSERCRAMMLAFQQVIRDYEVPENSTLSRSLATHLSHQIEVLKSGRGLSVSMGNAIRWLKQETSELRIDVSDQDAKAHLVEVIDVFIRDRLDVADKIIVADAASHVRDEGDVILTHARSQVVVDTLLHAHTELKKRFRVIVADAPPLFEGRKAAAALVAAGIPTTYIAASALPYVMKGVTTLMVGAHAMVSNGNLYSRVGTAMVAVLAAARGIPTLVLCETIKFSDRVQLDAFSVNEFIPNTDHSAGTNSVFFDLTDQSLISKVITEVGALPASSVPVILREYKQLL